MKFALPLVLCLAFAMTACNTIENRRSLYATKKADGPYTRSLQDGSWRHQKTVDEQYEEGKRQNALDKEWQKGKERAGAPQPTVN